MTPDRLTTMTVAEVKTLIAAEPAPGEDLLHVLEGDSRTGVQRLAQMARRRMKQMAEERARLECMCALENELRARGS